MGSLIAYNTGMSMAFSLSLTVMDHDTRLELLRSAARSGHAKRMRLLSVLLNTEIGEDYQI